MIPSKVKEIAIKYSDLTGSFEALEFSPAHIVWGDGNFENAHIMWCLMNWRENMKYYDLTDPRQIGLMALVLASLAELLAIPEDERIQESESYNE